MDAPSQTPLHLRCGERCLWPAATLTRLGIKARIDRRPRMLHGVSVQQSPVREVGQAPECSAEHGEEGGLVSKDAQHRGPVGMAMADMLTMGRSKELSRVQAAHMESALTKSIKVEPVNAVVVGTTVKQKDKSKGVSGNRTCYMCGGG
ncbi:hypothetical protein NDU88_007769 [Pleurodeles waltl]|uniref:Uncharacterized protein n=1 Tax=Pleurodeles waltl TaxID=8319 RepID=A0AAV7N7A1_PLEWA|nr:hypothetical protein NDU88_007769 [Pleurodeles waltl]